MTLPIERARTRRPVTWLTVLGVLLLPAVIGGLLVAALYNPNQRLSTMNAAIVNNDKAVTLNGQMVPLGRQLTAGLVQGGSSTKKADNNLTWTISNAKDAASGLKDGTYQAVVTIPKNFSAAATSSGQTLSGKTASPEQATIQVESAPNALVADGLVTSAVTQAASTVMGQSLSSTTLENVFIGYSTLGSKLGDAATGATSLASGAQSAADGAAKLPAGATQLQNGAVGLSTGAASLADGLGSAAGGARKLQSGEDQLASGLSSAAGGARRLQGGAEKLAKGANDLADGASKGSTDLQKAGGLLPADSKLRVGAADTATAAASLDTGIAGLAKACSSSGASADFCGKLAGMSQLATGVSGGTAGVSQGLEDFNTIATDQIAGSYEQIATGATQLSGGNAQLAGGIGQLASGLDQSAAGATKLSGGIGQLASGIDQSSSGARQLSNGAAQLATGLAAYGAGTQSLADGVQKLATGTDKLAGGLHQASGAIPSMSKSKSTDVANVLADPVAAKGVSSTLFGASAIPLLSTIALWFGALASFVALQAVSRRVLASRRSSGALALRSLLPAAAIGAAQGLLVAGIVEAVAKYDAATWWPYAGICVVAGVVFAAVNQALVAVFGGFGRWVSALIGVLALATGIISTVPGVLASVASFMPTAPVYNALLAVLNGTSLGADIAGMLIWGAIAFVATVLAVARRRTTSAKALRAAPVPA
ncbi:hypothetical protein LK09_09015 [Microbacterium mangrovi]|uniref:ABC-2 type transporter transmembrane domain-containing protein n=1 Tax=Microbacterium mangrovi TaxID=1348253 RepID=A0A0B2A3A5_9MICO|nr:YhgE/Pip domain-containing protein [Microbacterium mangrovi]KHK97974.1 hypothetical protein LK09_09015 [Microbacterium mangrovi]